MASKWQSTAGPRMNKQVLEALRDLDFQKKAFKTVNGVQDGSTAEEAYNRGDGLKGITYNLFGAVVSNPKAIELYNGIGEKYGWQITRENYKLILADLAIAKKLAMDAIPYKDERRTPEKEKELRTLISDQNQKQEEKDAERRAAWAAILAKKPRWAEAIIIAEYNTDTSDAMTDYFANKTDRIVAIGWRSGSREDFKQLQAAAVRFPEIGKELEERRDNYSMGRGNYISDHGWDGSGTGWVVKSRPATERFWTYGPVPEDAIPKTPAPISELRSTDGITIRPSSLGKAGFIEVVFPEKPEASVIAELKSAGFRWALRNRCWYGLETRLPERYRVTA